MPHLSLSLLGGFNAVLDAQPITAFGSDKARALLAYLAVEAAHPQRRAWLSAMFWPDLPEKRAAHNLSQSLLRLRKALRENEPSTTPPFLITTARHIQFNPYSDHQLDVLAFRERLSRCAQHHHTHPADCSDCARWRTQAAELYRGDLLAGFFLPDSVAFEEWRLVQQEELHRLALETLNWLTVYHEQHGAFDRVQSYARRLIALEPWHEDAHLRLMRALARTGQPTAALRQYEHYRQTLADELGLAPAAAVTAFYEQMRTGATWSQPTAQPTGGEADWLSSQGERRQITTLACGLVIDGDGDGSQEPLSHCERYCEAVYHRFGGRRAPRQGNVCLVYFGYPQAYEDAARRAVHAGLAVAAAVTAPDAIRIGIHTGEVTVGARRGPRWQDRDLIGNAIAVARDCRRLAEPGQVVISETTRRLIPEAFDLAPLAPPAAGAASSPLPVYRVHRAGNWPSRLEWLAQTQRLTVFAGRNAALQRLLACRDRARLAAGQIVLLSGEPGIGKSRLVWELKQRTATGSAPADADTSPAVVWLAGQCLPHLQNTSLFPVIRLLEQLLGFQTDDAPAVRQRKLTAALARYQVNRASDAWLLAVLLGLPTDTPAPETITAAHREQMRALFLTLLQKRAGERPLVVVIEDLQWSDPSTVAWLGESLGALADVPCLLLLTARPQFKPPWLPTGAPPAHLHRITLDPLGAADVEQMVADLADAVALDDALRQHIVARTDGIPLFVEEMTKALIEHSVTQGAAAPGAAIPLTLRDLLVTRLDHLGAAKETAQWAAVLGREFAYPLLQACTACDDQRLQTDLARLIEAGLVAPLHATGPEATTTARYTFRHALMQEAAYASLLQRTRQQYHRHAAEVLTSRLPQLAARQPEIVAQHYAAAGLASRAVDYWLAAGERAAAQGATLEARAFFDDALAAVEPADSARRWHALLSREAVLNLREERAAQQADIAALLQLADDSGDDGWRAQAFLRQAQYALRQKDFRLMLGATDTAIAAAARAGDRACEVRGLAYKVTALAYVGEWDGARQAVEETLARLPGVTDDVIRAFVLGDLGFYFSRIGDASQALVLMYQGAEAARRAGNRHKESRLNVNIGFVNVQIGRFAEACATFEAGLALAEAIGDAAAQTSHRYNLSYALWCSGEPELARSVGEKALQEFRATGHNTLGHACCLSYLGIYREAAGESAAAADYLAAARALYAGIGVSSYRMETQAVEARCMLALGRHAAALALATEAWAYVQQHGTGGMDFPSRVYLCLAEVLGACGVGEDVVDAVTATGYAELRQRAERISDAAWRRSFLENVPENRSLMARRQGEPGAGGA